MTKGNINYNLEFVENKKGNSINCLLENNQLHFTDVIAAYMIVYSDLQSDKTIDLKQKEQAQLFERFAFFLLLLKALYSGGKNQCVFMIFKSFYFL